MAVTKLSADAPPYLSPNRLQLSPPLPHPPPPLHMAMSAAQYHAATLPFPAVVATYPYGAPFFLAAPRPVVHGFTRPPPPARFLLKPAAVNNPFLSPLPPPLCSSESIPSPTSTLLPLGGTALSSSPSPPTSPPVRALSPEAAPFVPLPSDPFVPPPFGSAPHKLISLAGAGGVEAEKKLQAEGAEAAAAAAAGAKPAKPPRRGITKGPRRRRQAAEPAPVVPRAAKPARSPPPLFTTRPQTPVPAPEWRDNQELTTLMIRNIPNRLTPGELMLLLDDHCARANKKERGGGATLAAYDFLYLRMDFSR
ncbi:protein MEI2-like 7 [Brachypodium distachyon]|nr:protein MEI2-like 7 [Brachypodium distachyon]|eukprot:XP_014755902.1 protein MEI2-like 7 [Brachypodium distachyon]